MGGKLYGRGEAVRVSHVIHWGVEEKHSAAIPKAFNCPLGTSGGWWRSYSKVPVSVSGLLTAYHEKQHDQLVSN